MSGFLPMSIQEMRERGWERLDFLLISGDAYVDHPSFAPAIIGRLLESRGYKVGIIAQPDWRSTRDFKRLGRPRLAVLIAAGNLDSMLSKFTAAKKIRSSDSYSPGGQTGLRPERATIVYANRAREAYKKTPVIIGGIEASLRRFAHYDYWSDKVRRSVLLDSKADLLVFGMGERQVVEIAGQLAAGVAVADIRDIRGTCFATGCLNSLPSGWLQLPSFREVSADKTLYARSFKMQYEEQDAIRGKILVEPYDDVYVVQNPPAATVSPPEMDEIYDLPYTREYHPAYRSAGGVPALEEVKFSIVSHRGCFGACSFCAIVSHQGRMIQSRSHESIVKEAVAITKLADFKGYIHDVGGPTANFRLPACSARVMCKDRQCLYPTPCRRLKADHSDYLRLLSSLRALPGVKKVFIRSGIRYDYLLTDKNDRFLREVCRHHVSGQLKVAPEHVAGNVLRLMRKADKETYLRFAEKFADINRQLGKEQYLVPYFISSHPGCGLKEAVELAEFLRDIRYMPEQVQDFIPTPGSLSACMYYAECDPLTGEKLYVAKDHREKRLQRALLQYRLPQNYHLVYQALSKAGRQDLIGYQANCLIRPPHSPAKAVDSKHKRGRRNGRGG